MQRRFHYVTLGDLEIGLGDLLENRGKALEKIHAGNIYKPKLATQLAAIRALPEAQRSGRALVDELEAAEANHTGYGQFVWHLLEAYLHLPDDFPGAAELHATAAKIREQFMERPSEVIAPRPDKVTRAVRREPQLAGEKAALDHFPVAQKRTLYDVVSRYVKAGLSIGELIGARGNDESQPGPTRGLAAQLRTATIGLLNRLRAGLHDELDEDAAAAARIDASIFAYLDQLEETRQAEHATRATLPPPPSPLPLPPVA